MAMLGRRTQARNQEETSTVGNPQGVEWIQNQKMVRPLVGRTQPKKEAHVGARKRGREREGLAHVFAFLDLVHPALLVLGRGHGQRLCSGSIQQAAAAASALVLVLAVCESWYLELDRGIRFHRLSTVYLWVVGE